MEFKEIKTILESSWSVKDQERIEPCSTTNPNDDPNIKQKVERALPKYKLTRIVKAGNDKLGYYVYLKSPFALKHFYNDDVCYTTNLGKIKTYSKIPLAEISRVEKILRKIFKPTIPPDKLTISLDFRRDLEKYPIKSKKIKETKETKDFKIPRI